MIGAIVGAATAIGSSIFGGIARARAARKAKRQLETRKAENAAWYNREYNADETQRADAQRLISKMQDRIRERNKQAAATQAVVGGSEESTAANKEANSNAIADTASAINAQGEARKDRVSEQYRETANNLDNQLYNTEVQRSQAIADATGNAIKAAGSMASSLDAAEGKNQSNKDNSIKPLDKLSDEGKARLDKYVDDGNKKIRTDSIFKLANAAL